jgi:amidophosphoribosyltransferase
VVNETRHAFGQRLAAQFRGEADVVLAVPDSANKVAIAVAEALHVPFSNDLIRNHYTGRTFITPGQSSRRKSVRMKLNVVPRTLEGKRVIVVDDSIVRGTTIAKVVNLLRSAGVAEVHVMVGSPPVRFPCFYGIDLRSRGELIASRANVDEICRQIGADSLTYLPEEELLGAVGDPYGNKYCTACFTGKAPIPKHQYLYTNK